VGDFVIAAAPEFNQTNSVTEGVGHASDATPIVRLDLALVNGPGFECSADRSFNRRDDEIKMHSHIRLWSARICGGTFPLFFLPQTCAQFVDLRVQIR